jgi:tetratricopeptide (TPR) repeat protein
MSGPSIRQQLEEGVRFHNAGKYKEAEAIYNQVLRQDPGNFDALHLLGVMAQQIGRHQLSVDLIRKAIAARPNIPDFHVSLGLALLALKLNDESIEAFANALKLQPNHPVALQQIAGALFLANRWDESIDYYRKLLGIKPDHPDAWVEMGKAYYRKGNSHEAENCYRQGIALNPLLPAAHSNLGIALYNNGEFDRAMQCWRRAVALDPEFARGHFHIGVMLLTLGDWEQGWAEYEWRWKVPDLVLSRPFTTPVWDGSNLAGKRILLFAEQGFGDAIQFVRYLPRVAARGGQIFLAAHKELVRLFKTLRQPAQCVGIENELPEHDVRCSLLSLPSILKEKAANIPLDIPYLSADPMELEYWQRRMPADRFKIGLVWAGRVDHMNDRNRSMRLNELAKLAQIPGVWLASLQKGPASMQLKSLPAEMEIADWTDDLKDFADTAAFVTNLDLVVTVDTAVAHLAGALDKPVWVLLPFVPDWRWALNRSDSPWYPKTRLFRQPVIGDWKSVFNQVTQALREKT